MEEKYFKVDFHIHTPASSCYKGNNDDDEYIRILQKAYDEEIDVIAITDHNTISGYQKYMELHKKMITKKEILCEYSETSTEIKEELKLLEEKIMLFKKVKILLGVEITINPGVHIIIIVEEDDTRLLSNLLNKIGFSDEKRGEDSVIVSKMDINQLLSEQSIKNKIVIAPHVDSNNGIYKELKGTYRAEIFKSETLKAITCNNPKQLKNIQNMIQNMPEYQRNSSLAFLNASDSHDLDTIGSKSSYIKLEEVNYKNIYEALKVPEQTISDVENPKMVSVITNIINSGKAIVIDNLDEDLEQTMAKALCASLNRSYGHIVIGVNKTDLKFCLVGVHLEEEELTAIIKSAIDLISSRTKHFNIKVSFEKLGNGRSVSVITCKSINTELWCLKEENEVYTYSEGFKRTSILEIESIVRKNLINDLKKFEATNNLYVENALSSIHSLKNPIYKYELLEKIDHKCIPLYLTVDIDHIEKKYDSFWDELLEEGPINGVSKGNVYYAISQETRLKDAYLRCTCPKVDEDITNMSSKVKKNEGIGIVITVKGGTNIIEGPEWYVYALKDNALLLKIKSELTENVSAYSVLGWLKCSALIWYVHCKHDSTDLYSPNILKSTPLPKIECMKPGGEIEKLVKEIIQSENIFLDKFNAKDFCNQPESKCNYDSCNAKDFINEYNNSVLEIAKKIDEIIFSELELEEEQIKMIAEGLENAKIFNYIEI